MLVILVSGFVVCFFALFGVCSADEISAGAET
jgi:hypothetical protein